MWFKKLHALHPDKHKARFFTIATIIFQAASLIVVLGLPLYSGVGNVENKIWILFTVLVLALGTNLILTVRNYNHIKQKISQENYAIIIFNAYLYPIVFFLFIAIVIIFVV